MGVGSSNVLEAGSPTVAKLVRTPRIATVTLKEMVPLWPFVRLGAVVGAVGTAITAVCTLGFFIVRAVYMGSDDVAQTKERLAFFLKWLPTLLHQPVPYVMLAVLIGVYVHNYVNFRSGLRALMHAPVHFALVVNGDSSRSLATDTRVWLVHGESSLFGHDVDGFRRTAQGLVEAVRMAGKADEFFTNRRFFQQGRFPADLDGDQRFFLSHVDVDPWTHLKGGRLPDNDLLALLVPEPGASRWVSGVYPVPRTLLTA